MKKINLKKTENNFNYIQFFQKQNIMISLIVSLFFINCSSSDSEEPIPNINYSPTAVNNTLIVEENSSGGTANQINVSVNDDLGKDGGDNDNFSLVSNASNGIVSEVSDGVFQYIPNTDYFGDDEFTYKISDADGDSDTAIVTITVNSVGLTAEDFNSIDPNFPSFTSIDDTTPDDKKWVKLEIKSVCQILSFNGRGSIIILRSDADE